MQWTKDKPTVPGWYWYYGPKGSFDIVHIGRTGGGPNYLIEWPGNRFSYISCAPKDAYYYGPIDPPELPHEN